MPGSTVLYAPPAAFFSSVQKYQIPTPPGLVYPSTWLATAAATPLHYLFYSLLPYPYPHCVILLAAAHFWNRDHTNSFSLVTLPPTSSSSSHITPCIAFQESSNAALVIGPIDGFERCLASIQHSFPTPPYAPVFFLGLSSSCALNSNPIQCSLPCTTPARCFRNCCFLHPCPPFLPFGSYRIPSFIFLVTVVWNLPHSFLLLPSFLVPLSIVPP